jgi:hypothetical protein
VFQTITEALRGNAELLRSYPVAYTIGLTLVVTLVYLKWHVIGKAQQKALRDNFAGWVQDGEVSSGGVLILRPLNMRRIGVFGILFFGGGAWFMGMVAEPKPDALAKHWMTVVSLTGFAGLSLWVFAMSFDRILFDGVKIARTSWLARPFVAEMSTLERITPLSKTIAGGVRLHFADGRHLRLRARNSGYRQLLEALSERDLKLKIMLSALARQGNGGR